MFPQISQIKKFDHKNTAVPENVLSILKGLRRSLMTIDGVCSVVLFGSYSKGTFNEDSDIDIALFISDDKENKARSIFRSALRFSSQYPLDIQILVFTVGMLSDPLGIVSEVVEFGTDISEL